MNTDELAVMLARNVQAVDAGVARWRTILVLGGATAAALATMLAWLGARPDFAADVNLPAFWIKQLFCIALAAGGLLAAARLARPGRRLGWTPLLVAVPLLGMWALATVALVTAGPGDRADLLLGVSWQECALNIAVLSAPMFVAVIWWMRGLAPTRLRLAGTAGGFAAGALGALVYTLHCPEFEPPFLGLWYVLGILIPTAVGALAGPRLLRW